MDSRESGSKLNGRRPPGPDYEFPAGHEVCGSFAGEGAKALIPGAATRGGGAQRVMSSIRERCGRIHWCAVGLIERVLRDDVRHDFPFTLPTFRAA